MHKQIRIINKILGPSCSCNNEENFTEVSINSVNFLENSFSCKIIQKSFFDKCLLFRWLTF